MRQNNRGIASFRFKCPQFPHQDLTEANAELLELLLANASIVQGAHVTAESASWVYRVGHPAIRQAAQRTSVLEPRAEAMSHGVSAYETIAALVQGEPTAFDSFVTGANAVALAARLEERELLGYIEEARQHFGTEMPRTVEVVETSSERFYRNVAGYAVLGAALARQFELDSAA